MKPLTFMYINHRKQLAHRRVVPTGPMYWGTTEYYPEYQWLLPAYDLEKLDYRVFALNRMRGEGFNSECMSARLSPDDACCYDVEDIPVRSRGKR